MNVKVVITLMLGLVFQLAQVLPGAVITPPCESPQLSCDCCAGTDSCPCAENSETTPKPAPLLPAPGNDLKLPLTKSAETRVSPESLENPVSISTPEKCSVEWPFAGFSGVRLSVAFCSYII